MALIGAAATVLVAVIAGVVAIATTRGGDDAKAPAPGPSTTATTTIPEPSIPSSSSTSSPSSTKVRVDAGGARVNEQLRVLDGSNIEFDGGKPWKIKNAIGFPSEGQDFGVVAGYATGGEDAGVTTVPTDQPLGRNTCPSASGYAEGLNAEIVVGTAFCVHTTEGAYLLLVPTAVTRRSDPVQATTFTVYAW